MHCKAAQSELNTELVTSIIFALQPTLTLLEQVLGVIYLVYNLKQRQDRVLFGSQCLLQNVDVTHSLRRRLRVAEHE